MTRPPPRSWQWYRALDVTVLVVAAVSQYNRHRHAVTCVATALPDRVTRALVRRDIFGLIALSSVFLNRELPVDEADRGGGLPSGAVPVGPGLRRPDEEGEAFEGAVRGAGPNPRQGAVAIGLHRVREAPHVRKVAVRHPVAPCIDEMPGPLSGQPTTVSQGEVHLVDLDRSQMGVGEQERSDVPLVMPTQLTPIPETQMAVPRDLRRVILLAMSQLVDGLNEQLDHVGALDGDLGLEPLLARPSGARATCPCRDAGPPTRVAAVGLESLAESGEGCRLAALSPETAGGPRSDTRTDSSTRVGAAGSSRPRRPGALRRG